MPVRQGRRFCRPGAPTRPSVSVGLEKRSARAGANRERPGNCESALAPARRGGAGEIPRGAAAGAARPGQERGRTEGSPGQLSVATGAPGWHRMHVATLPFQIAGAVDPAREAKAWRCARVCRKKPTAVADGGIEPDSPELTRLQQN
ncbi:hypothetical protein NDU88_003540 [Pleurodeles waltl]|uniref:Uncharacterized protein n=1 Tax=Pleurodeles waltl TaxID=8319 RepID=A0AAV7Q996_PLEWA|nr:hypothetical protein NDU88_003540 [Pleurodeles waltl]